MPHFTKTVFHDTVLFHDAELDQGCRVIEAKEEEP